MTGHRISAGFMPLMDCLILVIAREKGFAAAEGIELTLMRETSWANIRDRTSIRRRITNCATGWRPAASRLTMTPKWWWCRLR